MFRKILFAVVVFVVSCAASAETQPASTGFLFGAVTTGSAFSVNCQTAYVANMTTLKGRTFATQAEALAAVDAANPSTVSCGVANTKTTNAAISSGNRIRVIYSYGPYSQEIFIAYTMSPTCPDSSWTLNGTTCERADCIAPKTRKPDGTCESPCTAHEGIKQDQYVPVPLGGTYCNGTCEYTMQLVLEIGGKNNADDSHYTDFTANGVRWTYGTFRQMWIGKECTGVKSPGDGPPGEKPPVPRKKPPCADGEGVLTTTAGHVGCVPEGVPDARKPVVNKDKKEEVYPDGSRKETETVKTKDPKTGATDVSQNSTATAGPGGGTQAGPPGSSSSNGSSSGTGGDGKGGEGCDPTLNFCGGPDVEALYEKKEKTFQSSLDTFKGTVSGSPVGQASTQFFTVSAPGGGCPGWVVTVPFINVTLNASEFFCNSSIMAALDGAGAVMLALATYIAFTWAFL